MRKDEALLLLSIFLLSILLRLVANSFCYLLIVFFFLGETTVLLGRYINLRS
jgi:hypothetical protein